MTPSVIALVLFAAILHATWNALLRSGADRLRSITVMSFATTAAALVCAALLPLPARASWPYLAASAALQVGYSVFLAYAYEGAALSQVYPVVRGAVPLLVTLGGYAWAGQRLGGAPLAGIALVSGGIASLALGRSRIRSRSFAAALATALFIGGYVTVDGVGSRVAGHPLAYAAWIFIAYGVAMPAVFLLVGGRLNAGFTRAETLKSAAGGLISLISYAAVVDALSRGPVGPIAALRETSIVFSVLIGWAWLGEKPSGRRFVACAAVAAGAACLTYPA
ncbi:multidrug DMT transporter permease [Burkholderia sp. MSMB617WGS]|uniref:Multidrug DMT transporter permease n=1 Tax=Burkholderia savannae TaxID=1637837 RepID=A0ABR5T4W7_9BURK|nr:MULTISPECIES: DMT family transporter [Burkholderia]AOJ83719.1 multidrug DMT transporter permease [Burkholderia savannae]AOK49961.1 multidrug DMT transporter permease [Burkholderia sp. MSMB617WGS]KGS05297.1 eamA-like transporter family protein [Burkholderia sp. ABCPW 111]KWZ38256.1 multidrug DMT transporter permease [Burkholderia savannae]KWZ47707.1 multidrug DMT transporter permease [Burkholderia savannae]